MQRVRIGLTGLACVFLLVLLAAAFFGLTNNEQTTGSLAVAPASTPDRGGNMVETPREPLAELGVAPGFNGDPTGNGVASRSPSPPSPVGSHSAR